MSAYIQLELDALNVIPRIGMLTGTKPAYVLMGLVELWAYCYRAKCSTIPTATFHAFFVTSPRLLEALQLFGFLDISEDRATLRVRGINRYFGSGKSQAELARKGGIARSTKGVRGPDGRYVRQAETTNETGNNTQDATEPKHRSSKRKAVRTPTMESPVDAVLDAPVDTRLAHTVKTVNDGQKPSLRAAQPSVQPSHAPLDAPVESRVDARLAHTDAKSTVTVSTARFTVPAPHETSTYNGGDEDEYSIEDALPPLSHSQTSVSAETVRAHRAPPAQTRLADTVHRTDVVDSNAGPATPADSQPYILDPKSYILPSLTGGRDARARVSLPCASPKRGLSGARRACAREPPLALSGKSLGPLRGVTARPSPSCHLARCRLRSCRPSLVQAPWRKAALWPRLHARLRQASRHGAP